MKITSKCSFKLGRVRWDLSCPEHGPKGPCAHPRIPILSHPGWGGPKGSKLSQKPKRWTAASKRLGPRAFPIHLKEKIE